MSDDIVDEYELSEDCGRINFDRVRQWLASTYWAPDTPMELVRRAAENSSLVISVYLAETGEQVGYGRIISDRATFAYIADIYVDELHRGRGLAKRIVRYALAHPEFQGLRRWMLATKDAHDVYAACGFTPLTDLKPWMQRR